MSILKRQVSSSLNFASQFIVMTHTSPLNFKHIHFLLWIKGSNQSPRFETFKCSGQNLPSQNLPNFSCQIFQFSLVFLHILHDCSMSLKITPLYFFRSNVIYYAQKEPIIVQIFDTFECSDQNSPNSCNFNYEPFFFSNFASLFSVMRHNSCVPF